MLSKVFYPGIKKSILFFKAASKAKRQGLYAELQIATIKLKLGHFREAKVALREILQEDPKVTWVV